MAWGDASDDDEKNGGSTIYDDGNGEEEDDSRYYQRDREKLIFMVDCGPEMFVKDRGSTRIDLIMRSVLTELKKHIARGTRDEVGVVLFGDDGSRAVTLAELGVPTAQAPRTLLTARREGWFEDPEKLRAGIDSLLEAKKANDEDVAKVCVTDGGSLRNGLFSCSRQFAASAKAKKTGPSEDLGLVVYVFSASREPCSSEAQAQVCNRLSTDLADSKIKLHIWYFGEEEFCDGFWSDFLLANKLQDEDEDLKEDDLVECRARRIEDTDDDGVRLKKMKQRSLTSMRLRLPVSSNGGEKPPEIRVELFVHLKHRTLPSKTKTNVWTNEKVLATTTHACLSTAMQLTKHEKVAVMDVGGTELEFEDEDIKACQPHRKQAKPPVKPAVVKEQEVMQLEGSSKPQVEPVVKEHDDEVMQMQLEGSREEEPSAGGATSSFKEEEREVNALVVKSDVDAPSKKVAFAVPKASGEEEEDMDELSILGFVGASDATALRQRLRWSQLGATPGLIYPKEVEDRSEGSTAAFAALVEAMRTESVVALAKYTRKLRSWTTKGPTIAVLVPVVQGHATLDGLVLFELLPVDCRRALPPPTEPREVDNDALEAMRSIIRGLDCEAQDRDPKPLNPVLLKFYSTMEALAIEPDDESLRNAVKQADRQLAPPDASALEPVEDALSRLSALLPEEEDSRPAKRIKAELPTLDSSMLPTIDAEVLKTYSNDKLKEFCKTLKLKVSGKKDILIERILEVKNKPEELEEEVSEEDP